MTKIKICGITNQHDAEVVNITKPDFAGLVFAPGRHQVTSSQAQTLRKAIDNTIPIVGVFVTADFATINKLYQAHIIQFVQLHGSFDAKLMAQLNQAHIPTIQVFKPEQEAIQNTTADYLMVDSGNGSGRPLNWQHLINLASQKLFVAGGINPTNAKQVITLLHPYALDVSSGVEVNQHKDQALVQEMVQIAHQH